VPFISTVGLIFFLRYSMIFSAPAIAGTCPRTAGAGALAKETLNNSIFHDPSSVFLVRWEKKPFLARNLLI